MYIVIVQSCGVGVLLFHLLNVGFMRTVKREKGKKLLPLVRILAVSTFCINIFNSPLSVR